MDKESLMYNYSKEQKRVNQGMALILNKPKRFYQIQDMGDVLHWSIHALVLINLTPFA